MNRNQWITQAARLQEQELPFALVTVLRAQAPTSAKAGDKALVTADGQIHGWIGGGCAQPAVIKTVRMALETGQPQNIRIAPTDETAQRTLGDVLEFGMACHSGGTLELFIDPVLPAPQLVVFGSSPVARALSGLAPRVGMQSVVVADGATAEDYPDAAKVLGTDEASEVSQAVPAGAMVVVATQGRRDLQALRTALALQPGVMWLVASERKASVLKQSLVAAGVDADQVAAIVAPAGEPIGAQTPEEIALAVMATVIAARRGKHSVQTPCTSATESSQSDAKLAGQPPKASGCCGGKTREVAPAEMPEAKAVGATAVKSCCGGA
ncbi:XdhC family protein [Hydrogenophaga sp. 5NK40-0174]|uniref:XdhC family protein n=1 Tax=Hydrogenophaga sp. 5NK40-0174 TaxID=3127649 RepID=UPI0031049B84